jgi:hypothetical protein
MLQSKDQLQNKSKTYSKHKETRPSQMEDLNHAMTKIPIFVPHRLQPNRIQLLKDNLNQVL